MALIGTLYGHTIQSKTLSALALAKYTSLEVKYVEVNPVNGSISKPEYKSKFSYGKM
ncbi:hypothetical protein OC861_006778 [Tilletia horrida]|nr:hypothetical protein OC861_006778 [Tilletia horrida]